MIVHLSEAVTRSVTQPVLLALGIWREARGAGIAAMTVVGQSIMNRVGRTTWWGKTLEEILGKKWQYSSLTSPGDPQLILWPRSEDPSWQEALSVARAVIAGQEPIILPGADSYYDDSITPPKWTNTARFCGKIQNLNFYDVDHDYEAVITGHGHAPWVS